MVDFTTLHPFDFDRNLFNFFNYSIGVVQSNWLDDTAILLTLLVIPFRIVNLDEQWVIVALAHILHCLRIFKYAVFKS